MSSVPQKADKLNLSLHFLQGCHGQGEVWETPGPRLIIKTVLSTYGDFHVKDKTAARTSYL